MIVACFRQLQNREIAASSRSFLFQAPFIRRYSEWQIKSEKYYTRHLDPLEKFATKFCESSSESGYRNLDILGSMQLSHQGDSDHLGSILQEAWKNMRFQHPLLAATCDSERFSYYCPKDEKELQDWSDKTFLIERAPIVEKANHCNDGSLMEDTTALEQAEYPVMAYISEQKKVVFRIPHVYLDALGAAIFFSDLLAEVQRLNCASNIPTTGRKFSSESCHLSASTYQSAGIRSLTAAERQEMQAGSPDPIDEEAIRIATKPNGFSTTPGCPKVQCFGFTRKETIGIQAKAKKEGWTVTAFVHAAALEAAKEISVQADKGTSNHSVFMLFNLRDRCRRELVNANARAFAFRVGMWISQIQLGTTLEQTASTLGREYRNLTQNKDSMMRESAVNLNFFGPETFGHISQSIMVSSLGNLDSYFLRKFVNGIGVKEMSIVTLPMNPLIFVAVQTFNEQLQVRMSYNEAYHDDLQVGCLLQQLRRNIENAVARS